jgi:protein-tyrosine sulfotransferase
MNDGPRESDKGVVVFGLFRSGTTLLRRLLNTHPRIHCPSETYLLSACSSFMSSMPIAEGMEVGAISGLRQLGYSEEQILERLRTFAFSFLAEAADRAGKPRWAEKTPSDIGHIDAIERLCGSEVRYLGIVRHGLDVVCSMEELVGKTQCFIGGMHDYIRRNARPLHAYAEMWRDVNEALHGLQQRRPNEVMVIRYEDLVDDPSVVMGEVFRYLGESPVEDVARLAFESDSGLGNGDWKTYATTGVGRSPVGRWRSRLSRHSAAELGQIVNPTLRLFDYETLGAPREITTEQAEREYRLRLATIAMRRKGEVDT